MKDQQVLDIKINPDKLLDANKYILSVLSFFKQNNQKNYDNYFKLDDDDSSANIDMVQKWMNKKYVDNQDFLEIFWTDSLEAKKSLIEFMHKILSIHQPDWYKTFDYNDKVDNSQNQKIINWVNEIQEKIDSKFSWKNIKEILDINSNPSREESFANLLFLFDKSFPIENLWISSAQSFRELTNKDISYIPGEDETLHWRGDISFEYTEWAFINIKQWSTILGYFRINNYNDQIILNQLVWNTTADDYTIPASKTEYVWERLATSDEIKK